MRRASTSARAQPRDGGAHVVREVGRRGGERPRVGAADAAVVEPQHDDAAA
jgi:hypothetical protein